MRSNSRTLQAEPDSVSGASLAARDFLSARDFSSAREKSAVWIAWNFHRRTEGLCDAFKLPLHVLQSRFSSSLRWVELTIKTIGLLASERPKILFVQNPSLALTTLVVLVRPLFRYFLVVDAHNEGIRPFDRPYPFVQWLTRRMLKSANLTIVTNDALADDVHDAGGRSVTLPDKLPVIPPSKPTRPRRYKIPDVAVIATFRRDEPIDAILEAAAQMPDVRFAFSGPAAHYQGGPDTIPPNVELTGFLPGPDYWRFLTLATVVCDLTLKPDCLVCGAYEALAAGKPMVLSDNPATRDIFEFVAVLTENVPDQIILAIRSALAESEALGANAQQLQVTYSQRWQKEAAAVWDVIVRESGPVSGSA